MTEKDILPTGVTCHPLSAVLNRAVGINGSFLASDDCACQACQESAHILGLPDDHPEDTGQTQSDA